MDKTLEMRAEHSSDGSITVSPYFTASDLGRETRVELPVTNMAARGPIDWHNPLITDGSAVYCGSRDVTYALETKSNEPKLLSHTQK